MKIDERIITAGMLFLLVFYITYRCSSSDPDKKIIVLRDHGVSIENPTIDPSNLIPQKADSTLISLRYVSRDKSHHILYYMDYTAEVDWDLLLMDTKCKDTTQIIRRNIPYNLYGIDEATKKVDSLLFYKRPVGQDTSRTKSSRVCSGFVCHNEHNELLFCRNYDGDKNPLVVVYNKAVKPREYKSVMMTELPMAQMFSGLEKEYGYDSCLLEKGKSLDVLLRQPSAIMDGMNEKGLCIAAYQLPNFKVDESSELEITGIEDNYKTPRPYGVYQNTGKPQITATFLHRMILSKCATVNEVINLFKKYDYVTTAPEINIHWYVADADGNWATLEFWKDKNGKDSLYVMDEKYRQWASYSSVNNIPYEYRCIENYYCNEEAARTYNYDYWQHGYSTKQRALNMMSHYSPVMTEEDALRCLQYGNFGIETPNEVTDWSCVYNPKKKTILFNMRDDLSTVYFIDLMKDLGLKK